MGKLTKTDKEIFEFINLLGSNIKTIIYDTELETWVILYKNGLTPDTLDNDTIGNFLKNA